MKYAVLFLVAAVLSALAAVLYGGIGWLFLWPALSFGLVGFAYLGLGPQVFGKRQDGSLAWANTVLLAPFLLYTWGVWHLVRCCSREPAYDAVDENIVIGRRLLAHEMPAEFTTVLDLTAEFPEPQAIRTIPGYRWFPILDASVPSTDTLTLLLSEFRQAKPEKLYIHCAPGHGRTGLVLVCLLIATGKAKEVDDALAILKRVRPLARLSPVQQAFVRGMEAGLSRQEPTGPLPRE